MLYNKEFFPFSAKSDGYVPGVDECYRIWNEFSMMEHIERHSIQVATVAVEIATGVRSKGIEIDIEVVRACGLLHDIAKTYTIKNGGLHSQLGASWMLDRTKNHAIAQAILHHVYWPGPLDIKKYPLPLIIIYSDKRVNHDSIVRLDDRMEYILERYGKTYNRMQAILYSFKQARDLEKIFSNLLEVDLDAYTFNSRGMV